MLFEFMEKEGSDSQIRPFLYTLPFFPKTWRTENTNS